MSKPISIWTISVLTWLISLASLQYLVQILIGWPSQQDHLFRVEAIFLCSLMSFLMFGMWGLLTFRESAKAVYAGVSTVLFLVCLFALGSIKPAFFAEPAYADTFHVRPVQFAVWLTIVSFFVAMTGWKLNRQ